MFTGQRCEDYTHFLFLIQQNLGPFCTFWAFRDYLWVGVWFKNFFGTYLCKQSPLVLEVQIYLFVLSSHIFGLFCTFLGLQDYFLARWNYFWVKCQVQKHFWSLPMLTISFGFGSTALSSCFEFSQIWGHFCTFWAFRGYFWGWGQVQNYFCNLLP